MLDQNYSFVGSPNLLCLKPVQTSSYSLRQALHTTPPVFHVCKLPPCLSSFLAVAYPGILFGGGGQKIQLRTEDKENRDLGAVAP